MPAKVSSNRPCVSRPMAVLASNAIGIELGNIKAALTYQIHPMMLIALAVILEAIFLRVAMPGDLKPRIVETIGLLLLSGLFYLVCTFLIIRHKLALPLIIAFAILFRLTFWILYPALSDDVFRYRWEGKLQAAGGNPYEVRPADARWAELRDATFPRVVGKDFKAVYGPLIEIGRASCRERV